MLWLAPDPLILASASPARRAMLEAAGLPAMTVAPELDERATEARAGPLAPADAALLLADAKARVVADAFPERLVVGADQTLAIDGERFAKPAGIAAAREQLRRLSGRTHDLCSAAAVVKDGSTIFRHCATARMTMRVLSDDFLDVYLAAAGSKAKASVGGYQFEALGVHLFERIEGDHFTILGLPLMPLLAFLRSERCLAA